MIVMINGAFGVGKTSTAAELVKRLPNTIIYDPEEVGFMLRSIIPDKIKQAGERTGDFQDLELWRILVVQVAEQLKSKYACNLLVPMTLRKKQYFDYIYNGFKGVDKNTFCFCLTASKECIHRRLKQRGDDAGAWSYNQTEDCLNAFSSEYFGEPVDAENMSILSIVEYIMKKLE